MSPTSTPKIPSDQSDGLIQSIRSHAVTLFGILALMWGLEIADQFIPFLNLDQYGIRPRNTRGLIGIPAAPLLHSGFAHLIANSVPFVILGGVVMLGGRKAFWNVTLFVVAAGGLGVWLFAATNSNHIGASGLVFGYLGFLLSRGFFERSIVWILVSFVILILYGGLIVGVLPSEPRVSWQSHLFGFGAGVVAAWMMFPRSGKLYRGPRTKAMEDKYRIG
jgi:membrane associated rhomboid family serine protease